MDVQKRPRLLPGPYQQQHHPASHCAAPSALSASTTTTASSADLSSAAAASSVTSSSSLSSSSCSSSSAIEGDKFYFDSYAMLGIHKEMLRDTVRTEAYCHAIMHYRALFAWKTVIDVGCGTGILSLFCAWAVAKCMFAIGASSMAENAEKVLLSNPLFVCIKGSVLCEQDQKYVQKETVFEVIGASTCSHCGEEGKLSESEGFVPSKLHS